MKHPRFVGAIVASCVVVGGGGGIILNAHADPPPPTGSTSMVPYALPAVVTSSPIATTRAAAPKVTKPKAATPTPTESGPSAALAITSGATIACKEQFAGCTTPVVAQSAVSIMDFTPGADAALTAGSVTGKPSTIVTMNISNDLQDGTQDWTFDESSNVGDASGLTAFDKVNYRGDLIASIEYTPFGRDTGLCLQPGIRRSTLEPCDGESHQEFILTTTIPLDNSATHGYYFMMWAPQAANAQHHLALDAPARLGGNVKVQRAVNVSPGQPSTFMWSVTP